MKLYLLIPIVFCLTHITALGQTITGKWKTIDDTDGQGKSIVEIYEKSGKYYGKIIELLPAAEGDKCIPCKGDKKNAPLIGMDIIWNMKQKGQKLESGKILDPKTGKIYKCKISLASDDVLDVRGFIGFSLIGRTQQWYRQ